MPCSISTSETSSTTLPSCLDIQQGASSSPPMAGGKGTRARQAVAPLAVLLCRCARAFAPPRRPALLPLGPGGRGRRAARGVAARAASGTRVAPYHHHYRVRVPSAAPPPRAAQQSPLPQPLQARVRFGGIWRRAVGLGWGVGRGAAARPAASSAKIMKFFFQFPPRPPHHTNTPPQTRETRRDLFTLWREPPCAPRALKAARSSAREPGRERGPNFGLWREEYLRRGARGCSSPAARAPVPHLDVGDRGERAVVRVRGAAGGRAERAVGLLRWGGREAILPAGIVCARGRPAGAPQRRRAAAAAADGEGRARERRHRRGVSIKKKVIQPYATLPLLTGWPGQRAGCSAQPQRRHRKAACIRAPDRSTPPGRALLVIREWGRALSALSRPRRPTCSAGREGGRCFPCPRQPQARSR